VIVGGGGAGTEQERFAKTPPGVISVITVVYVLVVVVVTVPSTTSSTAVTTCVWTMVDVTV
jgi:hypothetical protein